MTIRTVNGFPVYAVTSKEVPCELSHFAKQARTWVEGAKKDTLSQEEIAALKEKYGSKTMTDEDRVSLFGELVEAGIMSTSTARGIYCGAIPIDTSNYDPSKSQGVLTKCDPGYDCRMDAFGALAGMGTMLNVGGMASYGNWYDYAKANTDVDVEKSRYFYEYRKFLNVLEQIGA